MKKFAKVLLGTVCMVSMLSCVACGGGGGGKSEPTGEEVTKEVWAKEMQSFCLADKMNLALSETVEYPTETQSVSGIFQFADGKIYNEGKSQGMTMKEYFGQVDGVHYSWQWTSYDKVWSSYQEPWNEEVSYCSGAGALMFTEMLSWEEICSVDGATVTYLDYYDEATFQDGEYVYNGEEFTLKVKFAEGKLYSISSTRERQGFNGPLMDTLKFTVVEKDFTIGDLPELNEGE